MTVQKQSNRAYFYTRRSGSGQNELSHTGQYNDMAKYAAAMGLVEAGCFDDVGSGLSTDNRDGFLLMISKALDPANEIGHIVFPDLSRYSRSKVDPHIYLAMLDEADITVHSVKDGKRSDTDDISWDIQFSLNHNQSREISRLSLRAYPNNPAALRAIRAQAKCRKAM